MFPTAHYGNPGSYAGFTSADCRKEPFLRKGQKHGSHPDKSDQPAMLLSLIGCFHHNYGSIIPYLFLNASLSIKLRSYSEAKYLKDR